MKLFEVITEHTTDDSPEIITSREYVTVEGDSFLTLAQHYVRHCYEYEKELISIKEVLTIVQHITKEPTNQPNQELNK